MDPTGWSLLGGRLDSGARPDPGLGKLLDLGLEHLRGLARDLAQHWGRLNAFEARPMFSLALGKGNPGRGSLSGRPFWLPEMVVSFSMTWEVWTVGGGSSKAFCYPEVS